MKRQAIESSKYTGPVCYGVDLSHWNEWDWGRRIFPVVGKDTDLAFAVIRTGDGKDTDREATRHLAGARSAFPAHRVGAYHYFRADRGGREQAEHMLRVFGDAPGLFLALDLEEGAKKNLPGGIDASSNPSLPIDLVFDEMVAFFEVLAKERPDHRRVLYTGVSWHWWIAQGRPDLVEEWAEHPATADVALWLPSYSKTARMPVDRAGKAAPWSIWTLWQYTSKGTVVGQRERYDLNVFRGTATNLDSWAGVTGLPLEAERGRVFPVKAGSTESLVDLVERAARELRSVGSAVEADNILADLKAVLGE